MDWTDVVSSCIQWQTITTQLPVNKKVKLDQNRSAQYLKHKPGRI